MDIIQPKIFPPEIKSGVVTANFDLYPEYGFSASENSPHTESEIKQMRKDFANEIGVNIDDLIFQNQIHSDVIKVVNDKYIYGDSDGLVTNIENNVLCISIADCVAVLFYDPLNKIIGAIHSGWRGTKQNISQNILNLMKSKFNCKSENILAYISPSADVRNYEVSKEFLDNFNEKYFIKKSEKYFFDNKLAVYDQLLKLGIKSENIEISGKCTINNPKLHSYRRDGFNAGRMCAFISLGNL
jgi:purine-nucleoside/S-methyl-5'-thioadenosine phosphorylase / adenosine deaminase